jgi:hypothetical protein
MLQQLPPLLSSESFATEGDNNLGPCTFTASLEVRHHYPLDEENPTLRCCKSIEASFHVQVHNEGRPRKIGEILARLVDKTIVGPRGGPLWKQDLLRRKDTGEDVAWVLQQVFNSDGVLRPAFRGAAEDLEAETMIYLDSLIIESQYRGQGWANWVLQSFHSLLEMIDDQHKIGGCTMLLYPSKIPRCDYGERTDEQVVGSLKRLYGRHGYQTCSQEHTFMRVKLEDASSV